jgi:hypothetical protein
MAFVADFAAPSSALPDLIGSINFFDWTADPPGDTVKIFGP